MYLYIFIIPEITIKDTLPTSVGIRREDFDVSDYIAYVLLENEH